MPDPSAQSCHCRRGDQRYLAREAEANIQVGMSEEEARRQARMRLGAAESIRDQYHAEEGLPCWNV